METYNLAVATKKLYDSNLELFTLKTVRDILEVRKESTFFNLLSRLLQSKVLLKVERGKYALGKAKINDFSLANFLYSSSYVSFETALNFYNILSQFPYEITSATFKKPVQKTVWNKSFSYIHVQKNLFWGYKKRDSFLVATPEKALLDQLYLASKGWKSLSLDEYDFSSIDTRKFKIYLKKYPVSRQFNKVVKLLVSYFKL